MSDEDAEKIARAIARLTSLREGDAGFLDVVALGPVVVPALRRVLFAREPSGLPQSRRLAAEALAELGAWDVLDDFLKLRREIADPVERLGEDVVLGAVGRALARRRAIEVYTALLDAARWRPLSGILAGLGSFHRPESIPIFVAALAEDDLRPVAEAVLRGFGEAAVAPLLAAASDRGEAADGEGTSHLRFRRSALALLAERALPKAALDEIRRAVDDGDPGVALLACEIVAPDATDEDRPRLCRRLTALAPVVDPAGQDRVARLERVLGEGVSRISIDLE